MSAIKRATKRITRITKRATKRITRIRIKARRRLWHRIKRITRIRIKARTSLSPRIKRITRIRINRSQEKTLASNQEASPPEPTKDLLRIGKIIKSRFLTRVPSFAERGDEQATTKDIALKKEVWFVVHALACSPACSRGTNFGFYAISPQIIELIHKINNNDMT